MSVWRHRCYDTSYRDVKAIAAEVFRVQESDETLWDDSYELAAASGVHAEQLRELMDIWRYVGSDGRCLSSRADGSYRSECAPTIHDDLIPRRATTTARSEHRFCKTSRVWRR